MPDPVPASVELIVYCYLGAVAAVGLFLHAKLWRHSRHNGHPDDSDRSNLNE